MSGPFACIEADLAAVEEILRQEARSEVELAEAVCEHVRAAGGKRLRPALVVLSARALGCDGEEPLFAAAAVEMIHAATLLHDDVVDGAHNRRGRPTANARWGNAAAVMAGNLLLAKSFRLLVARGQRETLRVLSASMLAMCRGELLQNRYRGNLDMTEDVYYDIIGSKTADFLGACCHAGGLLADGDGHVPRLLDYGLQLGLAFQITDDLLDYLGDEQTIGKPVGGDLRERKPTLPLILALARAPEEDRRRMHQIATRDEVSPQDFQAVLDILVRTQAPALVRAAAEQRLTTGVRQLDALPPTAPRAALTGIAASLVTRAR